MQKRILFLSLALAMGCASGGHGPGTPAKVPAAAQPSTPPAAASAVAGMDICNDLGDLKTIPTIPTTSPDLRILAFGDFGDGGADQRSVAQAMVRYDQKHPFDFGLTLGDNFYQTGINDPESRRWQDQWEDLYNPLEIRLYATFGNHDYYDSKSPAAEIARSKRSRSWCMPRPYYTFTAGPVQFFALDTDPIAREHSYKDQLNWLDQALAASTASWKVVYGHHPVYSTGSEHGDTPEMIRYVRPLLLTHKVDIYLAGHDHNMEYLKSEGGLHFFVSGAGGHDRRDMGKDTGRRVWAVGMTPGFSVLEAHEGSLVMSFFDTRDKQLCKVTITKGQPDVADCP